MSRTLEVSSRSLFLDTRRLKYESEESLSIATATGFICNSSLGPVLVTNRHVLSGRNSDNKPVYSHGSTPTFVAIRHNRRSFSGGFIERNEQLYDELGNPRWFEHPLLGRKFDVAALPLTNSMHVRCLPYDPANPGLNVSILPTEVVSVIGYPFGNSGPENTALWATGFIASEINIKVDPYFWIDCRTRQGQSGSPVVAYREGHFKSNQAGIEIGSGIRFLGVYGSRMNSDSDLGKVWRAEYVHELIRSIDEGRVARSTSLD